MNDPSPELLSAPAVRADPRSRPARLSRASTPGLLALALLAAAPRGGAEAPLLTSFSVVAAPLPPLTPDGYAAEFLAHPDGSVEYRCFRRGRHFLSVLRDKNGAYAVRPHPGVDVNGWGTTVYPHPYLGGVPLTGATLGPVTAGAEGIATGAAGVLSDAGGTPMGTWSVSLLFSCDPAAKRVSGAGVLSLVLTAPRSAGQDVDVTKIASNFLLEVPLLTGGTGNTGDTTGAFFSGSTLAAGFWDPAVQPGHFPQDACDWIETTLPGCHNLVDTARQPDPGKPGQYLEPIAAAWKPSVQMRFALQQKGLGVPFMFGASYATGHATDFSADNVAVTPQLRHWAPAGAYDFDLTLVSEAFPGDANGLRADLEAAHSSTGPVLDAHWRENMRDGTWERVGSLKRRDGGAFSATLIVPDRPSGFLRAGVPP